MTRQKKPFQPAPTKTCGNKNCYKSEREAEMVAQEQELRDLHSELEIKVYFCSYCGYWHLSSMKNPKEQ